MARLTAFGAVAIPQTRAIRHYIIDCTHGTTELDMERTPPDDLMTLTRLLGQHRDAIAATEKQMCECEPTEAQLGPLRRRMV